MAADLAREIINQEANPPDQPTPFALRIPTEFEPGYFQHLTVTAPVKNGCQVLIIQYPESQRETSLVYSVDNNLEGAVFCLTSFMLYGDGLCRMEMLPFNTRVGGVDRQFTLASWNLTPTRSTNRERQDEVHQQVKKIVMTLFCESVHLEEGNEMQRGN